MIPVSSSTELQSKTNNNRTEESLLSELTILRTELAAERALTAQLKLTHWARGIELNELSLYNNQLIQSALLYQSTNNTIYSPTVLYNDPAIIELNEQLQSRIIELEQSVESLSLELRSVTFNSLNSAGNQLLLKCKKLQSENAELGEMINNQRGSGFNQLQSQLQSVQSQLIQSQKLIESIKLELNESLSQSEYLQSELELWENRAIEAENQCIQLKTIIQSSAAATTAASAASTAINQD